jgi:hypothetical protein
MIRPVLAVILIASAAPSSATDNPTAQQQLDSARRASDLFNNATDPFEMRIDLASELGTPVQGQMVIKWKSKDQWWSKVIIGPFQQITIRKGEEEYTLRNTDITSVVIKDLFGLLNLVSPPFNLTAKKQTDRTEKGVSLTCIQAQLSDRKAETNDYCLDPASHNIVSQEWTNNGIKKKRQYSSFRDFEGVHYPRQLSLFENQRSAISATITSLQAAAFDAALLTPPPGSIERRHCIGVKPPMPLKYPQPEMNPSTSTGSAVFSLTVLADGSVTDVHPMGGAGQKNDQATETIKHWKFTPAMCGTEPIVFDLQVVVSSNHI